MLLVGVLGPATLWLVSLLMGSGLWLMIVDSRWFRRLRRDPYSLDSLREADERAKFRAVEEQHMQMQLIGGYCAFCDETYPEEMRACPRCGRMM